MESIPAIYPASTKTSSTCKVFLPRKSPKKVVFQEDQYNEFKRNNNIISLESITESDCPHGYLFTKYEDHVVFHKIVLNELHAPEVTACIRMDDKLYVKLFLRGSPDLVPQWFRHGHNCKLTSKRKHAWKFSIVPRITNRKLQLLMNFEKDNWKRTKSMPVK